MSTREGAVSAIEKAIVQYVVGEKSNENAYGDLARVCASAVAEGVDSKEKLYEYLEAGELLFMEDYFHDVAEAKTKSGKWKMRTYLPKAYSSAKSVLGNAFDEGVEFMRGTEPIGKSAVEKAVREKRKEHIVPDLADFCHRFDKLYAEATRKLNEVDAVNFGLYIATYLSSK